jgi:hypothetical protein
LDNFVCQEPCKPLAYFLGVAGLLHQPDSTVYGARDERTAAKGGGEAAPTLFSFKTTQERSLTESERKAVFIGLPPPPAKAATSIQNVDFVSAEGWA